MSALIRVCNRGPVVLRALNHSIVGRKTLTVSLPLSGRRRVSFTRRLSLTPVAVRKAIKSLIGNYRPDTRLKSLRLSTSSVGTIDGLNDKFANNVADSQRQRRRRWRHRKTVEYEVFDESFVLIEKYVKSNTRGMSARYRREYSRAGAYVDWHWVLDRQLSGRGRGYVEAIDRTGELLRKCERRAVGDDRAAIDEIYSRVRLLIELRERELDPSLALLGWVVWGGQRYDRHKYVVNAWKSFL